MKSIKLFCVVLLFLSFTAVNAQKEDNYGKVGGVRGGWQMSNFSYDGKLLDSTNYMSKFYVGFFRDNKIIPMLFIGSGVEYMQNGVNWGHNSSRTLHIISVPIYLKFKIGPVFALGGAGLNFKVAEKLLIAGVDLPPENYGGKTNVFDVPVFVGLGLKIFFISVEARYHWGMLDVRDNTKVQYCQVGGAISF